MIAFVEAADGFLLMEIPDELLPAGLDVEASWLMRAPLDEDED
jgi:hypothetical protein